MTEQHDHEHYRIWFNRVGRGIALVGPSLILLIILATFVTRLFESPEDSAPDSHTERSRSAAPIEQAEPSTDDDLTTPAISVPAQGVTIP